MDDCVRRFLRDTLASLLAIEPDGVDEERTFVQSGMDSARCVVLIREINRRFDLSLSVSSVCRYPTPSELGQHVDNLMTKKTASVPGTSDAGSAASDVAAFLKRSLAHELECEESEVDEAVPFVELGLDSITGVTWARKLNTHFGISLSVTNVYSHPTLHELARFIASQPHTTGKVADQQTRGLRERTAAALRASLAKELDVAPHEVDESATFAELGLDSITGVTWTRSINTHFKLALSATTVYGHPTLRELTEFVLSQLPAADAAGGAREGATAANRASEVTEPGRPAHANGASSAVEVRATQRQVRAEEAPASQPRGPAVAPKRPASGARGLVDIAVVGMSGAFPKAPSLDAFWQNVLEGRDCVSEVPEARWRSAEVYDPAPAKPGKTYSKWMGVLEGVDEFDPLFFNISPSEADYMDPQQRLLLQESWRCLESAGYDPESFSGSQCGVFIGCSANGYGNQLKHSQLSAHQNLGSNPAILASRVSYFLNLRGPCLSIDTSCSSSLVAIATACDSLCLGTVDAAIAGGVWVIPGAGLHIAMSQLRALSPDGRCFAFDARANGFVPAEGIGVLLLKRLADAETAGDHIHAVIKGWGVNQDGKSNGITAPNADAQGQLIAGVYEKFGVNPRDIELVEAHGTGTALGDPVEIDGLVQGFGGATDERNYCALGSVKSNIGHTACAAGVASLMKAALALKHRVLPASIHCEELNPHIELSNTPFFINTESRPWPRAGSRPRMAAVSSFGYSGTNAHVVLAEAPEAARPSGDARRERLIVLSARSPDQLRQQVGQMVDYLVDHPELDLCSLSFTLLCGRKHFRHRLALVVRSRAQLLAALRAWSANGADASITVSDTKRVAPGSTDGADAAEARSALALYLQGHTVNGQALFAGERPARLALPTYPFARERHWIETEEEPPSEKRDRSPRLHPLVHCNVSTAIELGFSSRFVGDEFFLRDHRLGETPVLPGVAHLELAREALERALERPRAGRGDAAEPREARLENVVWLRPASLVAGTLELQVSVAPRADGSVSFAIFGFDAAGERSVFSQGRGRLLPPVEEPRLDLPALRARCREPALSAEQIYDAYRALGLHYGTAQRSIVALKAGVDAEGRPSLLAELRRPPGLADEPAFRLHPSVMDGALQATLALDRSPGADGTPRLPFALESLRVLRATPAIAFAWIRRAAAGDAQSELRKVDISICDADGRLCADLRGLSMRPSGEPGSARQGLVFMEPRWERADLDTDGAEAAPDLVEHSVWLIGDADQACSRELRAALPARIALRTFALTGDAPGADYEGLARTLLAELRERVLSGQGMLLQLVLVSGDTSSVSMFAGLSALLKCATLEHPRFRGQCIEYLDRARAADLAELVTAAAREPLEADVRCAAGYRYVRRIREVSGFRAEPGRGPWRDQGVYLITGGLGGIGFAVAQDIAQSVTGGALVLFGRSPLDAARHHDLSRLEKSGLTVEYQQVDVTERAAVALAIKDIARRHGPVRCILHCAGVLRDSFVPNTSDASAREVLGPKVAGVVNLDEATKDQPLDYFVAFSSNVGVLGNVGQADYAAANGFMDAYVAYRNRLAARGERSGRAVTVNWPLWAEGGMRVTPEVSRRIRDLGLLPLATRHGVDALRDVLAAQREQTLIFAGNRARILTLLASPPGRAPVRAAATAEPRAEPSGPALQAVQRALVASVSEQLKVPPEELALDCELSEYGFDSISLTEFANRLNERYELALAPTIFFEYPTLGGLAQHLASRAAERFTAAPADARGELESDSLLAELQRSLVDEVCGQLKLPVAAVDLDGQLSEYGFDSIALTELADRLNRRYGLALSPTVFFEQPTLGGLARYLVDAYGPQIGGASQAVPSNPDPARGADIESAPQVEPATSAAPSSRLLGAERTAIAIIGMSGCFPQAPTIEAFWENLRDARDCIVEIPKSRWDWQSMQGGDSASTLRKHVRWGGFIDGIEQFDPLFFAISPREAAAMDPQQRLLLIHVWQALEDAGYAPSSLAGSDTAVLIGTGPSGYGNLVLQARQVEDGYSATGVSGSVGPNRVSYLLDLHGPSEPIETACSSSLVAVHRGVELLREGKCTLALVGGVNTIVNPDLHIAYSRAGMLSEDGRCKPFSAEANGYVRGEGVGILVLKPLVAAERDGDAIYGVIRGSAENHGGRAHSLTAPNPNAQAELLKAAYRQAGIDPRTVTYIETHGTGTELGDPIEINALKKAFRELAGEATADSIRDSRCGLGSVKSNIGHLELAAGVAGVVKTLLQMKHGTMVESLHAERLNPYIDLQDSPFHVVQRTQPWTRAKDASGQPIPRRAGVSSFGFGGVNAHVVLEEYEPRSGPTLQAERCRSLPALIVVSAKTEQQLLRQLENLLRHLDGESSAEVELADVAYTLQVGRDAFSERAATRAASLDELREKLRAVLSPTGNFTGWHRGTVAERAGASPSQALSERLRSAESWIEQGDHERVLARWVEGHPIPWERLYAGAARPRRTRLPTYPFARERCWIDIAEAPAGRPDGSALHPLLHRNVSTVFETAYASSFDGDEFFLRDHRVLGRTVLPAAAHVEAAREAIARAFGADSAAAPCLKDVIWLQPAAPRAGRLSLRISVRALSEQACEYAIGGVDADGKPVTYSEGRAELSVPVEPATFDLAALRAACDHAYFAGEQVYALYESSGMAYGAAQRTLTELRVGYAADGRPQVLATLRGSGITDESSAAFCLHPSILDGALQATLGLKLCDESGAGAAAMLALPFSLETLRVTAPTPRHAYAWIQARPGPAEDAAGKLDLTILDEAGRVCVELSGLGFRAVGSHQVSAERSAMPSADELRAHATTEAGSRAEPAPDGAAQGLAERALAYFKQRLAAALQLGSDRLDVDVPMERYGMDSMMAMDLTRHLEKTFGALPKTLFFEVQTIRALSEHFISEYPEQLRAALGVQAGGLAAAPDSARARGRPAPAPRPLRRSAETLAGSARAGAVAIVGVSGRYPEAEDLGQFWENLRSGKDCIREIPRERWDHAAYFHPDKASRGTSYSKWGGFIDGVDRFDPLFFRISPREAEYIDPQERLFLQCVYETIEDAGYTGELLVKRSRSPIDDSIVPAGKVGVFVGVMYQEYQLYGAQAQSRGVNVALSGNPSSIANRVSYFFDFHGPSMAVDTMCSSSLTAIHLACEAIKSGQCQAAIAGGVNVNVHPNKYLMLSQGKFASTDGRCRSFGAGGDGYVPGEGVGAVLLKPLDQAIADRDNIYAVIRGTALNHGGKTNGFSVPNPLAQGDVILDALSAAQVEPRSISYIEAHGTGTSLGDPIEIAGLMKAFQRGKGGALPAACALGSVKSNIGHCESAAGIAGVTKVLLQMKHQLLVPSLHSSQPNPHILFEDTPFRVQQRVERWERPVSRVDGSERSFPRIAGVSSFGAGGSNAHVILEEYERGADAHAARARDDGRPSIIVLSAMSELQLVVQARRLRSQLDNVAAEDLDSVAMTLQVGRVAMDERLAFTVNTLEQLKERLEAFIASPAQSGPWYRGTARQGDATLASFVHDEDLQQAVSNWLSHGKHDKLLSLWVRGLSVDWEQLYPQGAPVRRLSLPTYPFAKERYWLDVEEYRDTSAPRASLELIRPLLQREESTAAESAFCARFDGSEFFLDHHRVRNVRTLPAAVHLELARESVAQTLGASEPGAVELLDTVWLQPAACSERELRIRIRVRRFSEDEVRFEIFALGDDDAEVLSGQGRARSARAAAPEPLALAKLRAACSSRQIDAGELYAAFAAAGLHYGPSHRGVVSLACGGDGAGSSQALAELRLPDGVRESARSYGLHPSIVDSALQACAGVMAGQAAAGEIFLPFSVQSVRTWARTPERGHAWVRHSAEDRGAHPLLDIDICDEHGHLCVELRGLALRPLRRLAAVGASARSDELILLGPRWDAARAIDVAPAPPRADHRVLLLAWESEGLESMRDSVPAAVRCDVLRLRGDLPLDAQYRYAARELFARTRAVLEERPREPVLLQVVLLGRSSPEGEAREACFAGLTGLLRTAQLENPRLLTQYIQCLDAPAPGLIAERILENARAAQDQEVRYCHGRREVKRFEEVSVAAEPRTCWREGGRYLISGGAGGLGLIVAKAIAGELERGTVILMGRSELGQEQRTALAALQTPTLSLVYRAADVTDRQALAELMADLDANHGPLTGVVHAAGMVRDSFIIKKAVEEFDRVLAPKVDGLTALDEATQGHPLDFFVMFSSMTGALGNPGQADYAAANGFMDGYAAYRNRLVARGKRCGRTLSVNWPLWEEGGMQVSEAVKLQMRQAGLATLGTAQGLYALSVGLTAYGQDQLLVSAGSRHTLLGRLTGQRAGAMLEPSRGPTAVAGTPASAPRMPAEARGLEGQVLRYVTQHVAAGLKLAADRLDPDVPLERYGLDSVLAMGVLSQLERAFGALSKTLFFELQTIRAMAEHLMVQHRGALEAMFGAANPAPRAQDAEPAPRPDAPVRPAVQRAAPAPRPAEPVRASGSEESRDVAIIAMSGRYPKAHSLREFWANLRAGEDCVEEIPASRWNHAPFFDPSRDALGKSYGKWGSFIDGVDQFDPLFFNIAPREAEAMDPQQRLFLETVWRLFEDGGITQASLQNRYERRVGVYVGSMYQMYRAAEEDVVRSAQTAAVSYNMIANRVSYFFGLEGPSLAVDSMCSSSAMAIHLARQDLLRGETLLAVAGGVNLSIHPKKYVALSQAQMLASHMSSRSFRDGDGYIPAEAVGAVLLKPLAAALRDGDRIHAVIKGSASLHGGRANRFMTPSFKTQVKVIQRCLAEARAEPTSISYIEAAASGSALGDAVEVSALKEVFGALEHPVALGSVKSNIGHPEAASGIAQLTKVVLQLQHREIAPILAVGAENPNLQLDGTSLRLSEQLLPWAPPGSAARAPGEDSAPNRALINSVGAGGSYVAIVVEAAPEQTLADRAVEALRPALILLSAASPERLREIARDLVAFVAREPALQLADVAYTLQVAREHLPERLALVASSIRELSGALEAYLRDADGADADYSETPRYRGNAEDEGAQLKALVSGPNGEAFIASLLEDGDLGRLGALWVRGVRIDWERLHGGARRVRVPLPGYPFRRDRYWLGPVRPPSSSTRQEIAAAALPARSEAPELGQYILSFLSGALGLAEAEIPLNRSLQDLGVDSILWAGLQRALLRDCEVKLSQREIVEARTLERLVASLTRKRAQASGTGTNGHREEAGSPPSTDPSAGSFGSGAGAQAAVAPAPAVIKARADALNEFKNGNVSLEDLKRFMREGLAAHD